MADESQAIEPVSGAPVAGKDVVTGAEVNPPDDKSDAETDKSDNKDQSEPDKSEDKKSDKSSKTKSSKAEDDSGTEKPFTKSVDIKKLPKEMQRVYKQMQSDYTKKTQEAAKYRKSAEAYSKFRPYLTRIFSNPALQQAVFEGKDLPTAAKQEEPEETIPDDPKEYAEYIRQKTLQDVQKMMAQDKQLSQQQQVIQQDLAEAEKVDPRLSSDKNFANAVLGFVASDIEYRQGRKSAVDATKEAIEKYDVWMKEQLDKSRDELINKAKSRPSDISKSGGNVGTVNDSKTPKSIREAWLQAEAEQASKK